MSKVIILVSLLGALNLACKYGENYSWTEDRDGTFVTCYCNNGFVTCI